MMMNHRMVFGILGIGCAGLVASQLTVTPAPSNRSTNSLTKANWSPEAPDDLTPMWATDLQGDPFAEPEGQYLDVEVSAIGSLSQRARTGSFPSGRIGLAGSTTSCNIGNVLVPWYRQMDPRHPFIAQNLYRINPEGRLDMIGTSWLKHGFFAADASGCGDCDPDFGNDHLDLGCQDTYGAGNNSDRSWLGPRYEVDPITGAWDPCGSHFDIGNGSQPDCRESNHSHGPIDHMLRVYDEDLDVSGSEFVYEVYYIVADDDNYLNNSSFRGATFNRNGNSWNPGNTGTTVRGMYAMHWGDFHHFVNDRSAGDAIVASRIIDLGGGQYRYEYGVFNHSVAQQINKFSVAIGDGVTVTNAGFHGVIEDETPYGIEDWTFSDNGSTVSWNVEDFDTNQFSNSLRFGTMYTFWFEADAGPDATTAYLDLHKPGNQAQLAMGTVGPGRPDNVPPAGVAMTMTELRRGQDATWTIVGCEPNEKVYLAYSEAGFSERVIGIGPTRLNGLNLDIELLRPGKVFATGRADANGTAVIARQVPWNASLVETAFQAVVPRGQNSVKSNVALRSILP